MSDNLNKAVEEILETLKSSVAFQVRNQTLSGDLHEDDYREDLDNEVNTATQALTTLINNEKIACTKQVEFETLETVSIKFDELHQGTPGAGYVSYGEFGEWLDEQIASVKELGDE